MDIDPRLREEVQAVPQSYSSVLPPPSANTYPLNNIRLPPPQQQQQQQQPNQSPLPPPQQQQHQLQHHNSLSTPQQHHNSLPPWSQEPNLPYYTIRNDSQPHALPPPGIHPQESLVGTSQPSEEGTIESKRPRACEACRGLKVKCDPDPTKSACKRCAKAGRACIVTAPCRKRQKKTDSRVEELEKKINGLEAILHARSGPMSGSEDGGSYEDGGPAGVQPFNQKKIRHERVENMLDRGVETTGKYEQRTKYQSIFLEDCRSEQEFEKSPRTTNHLKRRRSEYQDEDGRSLSIPNDFEVRRLSKKSSDSGNINPVFKMEANGSGASSSVAAGLTPPSHEYADIIDKKILDAATANKIFSYYISNMAAHMPIVVFPSDVEAGTIRKNKPTLFLAILSVASAQDYPQLQSILTREIMNAYADRLIRKHERSLELVQALQVSTTWYSKDANFYQLIHLAATMSIELGLSSQTKTHKERSLELWKHSPSVKLEINGKNKLESQRAWLGCYFLCANAAMGSRRQNLIRWTPYMDECLRSLENSTESLPSDKIFCQWIKLQRLADNLGTQISTDDFSHIDTTDQKTQSSLEDFGRQLKEWEKQKSDEITSSTLTLGFHVINLYMHDFAMPLDPDLENLEVSHPTRANKNPDNKIDSLSSAHVAALTTCLKSIHGIFETFLALAVSDVRALPVFHFPRLARASVLLIKMYAAANIPDAALGKVISGDDIKVEHYLGGLIALLRAGASEGNFHPAHHLSLVLVLLQSNFKRMKDGKSGVVDEIAVAPSKVDARPIDTLRYATRQEYQKMHLESDHDFANDRASPPNREQNSPPQQTQVLQPAIAAGDDALHLLSEVAMGNSAPNGHHHDASWYGYSNPGGPPIGGAPPPPFATDHNYYHHVDAGCNNHPGVQALQAGYEQAIEMTFGGGSFSIMDDDGFYHIMQQAPPGILGGFQPH